VIGFVLMVASWIAFGAALLAAPDALAAS